MNTNNEYQQKKWNLLQFELSSEKFVANSYCSKICYILMFLQKVSFSGNRISKITSICGLGRKKYKKKTKTGEEEMVKVNI